MRFLARFMTDMARIRFLMKELNAGFARATEFTEADEDCHEQDADGYTIHEDGCGCNFLGSLVKYEEGYTRFNLAMRELEDIVG